MSWKICRNTSFGRENPDHMYSTDELDLQTVKITYDLKVAIIITLKSCNMQKI